MRKIVHLRKSYRIVLDGKLFEPAAQIFLIFCKNWRHFGNEPLWVSDVEGDETKTDYREITDEASMHLPSSRGFFNEFSAD